MGLNPALIKHKYARPAIYTLLAVILAGYFLRHPGYATPNNGFNLTDTLIPAGQIYHGGPPKDGIPAIDKPKFLTVRQAGFLKPEDRVLGVTYSGISKAYPVRILNYHEIVNDKFQGKAIVITYCPLCGTGMAFHADISGRARSFGVSGLLYNSDMLLYDRESESLWSQLMKQAISGPLKGEKLQQISLAHTTWRDWKKRHPQTQVLSTRTGYSRDYSRTPYPGYSTSDVIMFPVNFQAAQYHPKEQVLGIEIGTSFKAYPFSEMAKLDSSVFNDMIAGRKLQVQFDPVNRTGKILDENRNEIPTVISFWFAWVAFHPESEVFKADM
ncbi:MAG: DUF3179 domain-containing protein [Halobacteria archaeon]|nr:DUF3179 domain-containing protein [Halobacteria archaeon]